MNLENYVERVVRILDASVEQDLGDPEEPKFTQFLHLLLRDVNTEEIISTTLNDAEICQIVGIRSPLTSKQLIDLSILLREREEPLKLLVPKNSNEISASDILKTKSTKRKNRKRRPRRKPNQLSGKNNIKS